MYNFYKSRCRIITSLLRPSLNESSFFIYIFRCGVFFPCPEEAAQHWMPQWILHVDGLLPGEALKIQAIDAPD
jgi:hypothetical protein